jgi:hypothetical protein
MGPLRERASPSPAGGHKVPHSAQHRLAPTEQAPTDRHFYTGRSGVGDDFKTCDALRANNYFSGPQFGAAGAGIN